MVDPVRAAPVARQPQTPPTNPATIRLTVGNRTGFKELVHGIASPPPGALRPQTARGPSVEEDGRNPRARASQNDAPDALAPALEDGGGRLLDPAAWLALINPSGGSREAVGAVTVPVGSGAASLVPDLTQLMERWVRKVGLGGDARRGVARLDIGSGRLSGTELLVVAEEGHVSVELSLPAGHADSGIEERLRARLERRGFATDVSVR